MKTTASKLIADVKKKPHFLYQSVYNLSVFQIKTIIAMYKAVVHSKLLAILQTLNILFAINIVQQLNYFIAEIKFTCNYF